MATTLKPTDEQQMNVVRQFIGAMNKLPIGAKINFSCEPFKTDDKATVWFTHEAWEKMCALIDVVGEKEVGWHATVERNDEIPGHNYMVTDLLVYPQKVGSATVNTDQEEYQNWLNAFPDEVFNNIRGHFHSHVNFDPSPSPTDDAHVESIAKQLSDDMFYLFMIWNKKLKFTCRLYDLRENLYFDTKDVEVKTIDALGIADFLKAAKSMIQIKTYSNVAQYNGAQSSKSNTGTAASTKNTTVETKLPMRQQPMIGAGWRSNSGYDDYEDMDGHPYYS